MDFQYLDTNYLFGLVEKVRPDMVKKLGKMGPAGCRSACKSGKQSTSPHRPTMPLLSSVLPARDNTEECCHEVLNYLCEILSQEDFPRSYAVEFKGPEKSYLPITGLPKKGENISFCLCRCSTRPSIP